MIGDPQEVADGLVHRYRHAGVTHLSMRESFPGSSGAEVIACLELLGREVLLRARAMLA